MIDGTDEARFEEAKETLHELMRDEELLQLPLLVLLNKNDADGFKSVDYIAERLGLYNIAWKEYIILPVSALMNKGVDTAINWIFSAVQDEAGAKENRV